jgi:hypothetical protein
MIGHNAFEQIVAFADRTGNPRPLISQEEFNQWREDFIWEALHGQRYGQSFCNRFGITDNHLYYNDYKNGGVEWADAYIKKTYLERA